MTDAKLKLEYARDVLAVRLRQYERVRKLVEQNVMQEQDAEEAWLECARPGWKRNWQH